MKQRRRKNKPTEGNALPFCKGEKKKMRGLMVLASQAKKKKKEEASRIRRTGEIEFPSLGEGGEEKYPPIGEKKREKKGRIFGVWSVRKRFDCDGVDLVRGERKFKGEGGRKPSSIWSGRRCGKKKEGGVPWCSPGGGEGIFVQRGWRAMTKRGSFLF